MNTGCGNLRVVQLYGGLALLRWGEPSETIHVDLTLLTGFGGEDRFVAIFLNESVIYFA